MRFLLMALALFATATAAQERAPDVPFVPTPVSVVERMLELAEVRPGDVLYDLGSGDGRMVILGALRGARGVGIDINPAWVQQARSYAERYGVQDRVTFRVEDIFTTDVSEATVLMLYLLPEVNRKLEPKLRAELKPGTRVVSHEYLIGDWVPQKSEVMQVGTQQHEIHMWTVPAR